MATNCWTQQDEKFDRYNNKPWTTKIPNFHQILILMKKSISEIGHCSIGRAVITHNIYSYLIMYCWHHLHPVCWQNFTFEYSKVLLWWQSIFFQMLTEVNHSSLAMMTTNHDTCQRWPCKVGGWHHKWSLKHSTEQLWVTPVVVSGI